MAVPGGRRAVGLKAEISHNVSEGCKPSFQLGTIIEPLALRLVQCVRSAGRVARMQSKGG